MFLPRGLPLILCPTVECSGPFCVAIMEYLKLGKLMRPEIDFFG